MPRVERERKLAALANFDRSVEEIREITGPAGPLFPLAPNPMAASTVRSLKRRYGEYDDVLHRKQRVDGGTLRTAELQLLYSTFAGPDARAKTTTPQLQEQLIRRFLAGRAALGLPSSFPPATVNDAVRAMNHTYKLLTPQPLGVNLWERVLQHDLADYVRSVPLARCGNSAVCAHRHVSLCPVCLTATCCLVARMLSGSAGPARSTRRAAWWPSTSRRSHATRRTRSAAAGLAGSRRSATVPAACQRARATESLHGELHARCHSARASSDVVGVRAVKLATAAAAEL
jgi:hypothetical protein